jgi:hypothetical protein
MRASPEEHLTKAMNNIDHLWRKAGGNIQIARDG